MQKYLLPIIFGILVGISLTFIVLKPHKAIPLKKDTCWAKYKYKVFDHFFGENIYIKAKLAEKGNSGNISEKTRKFRLLVGYKGKSEYTAVDFLENSTIFRKIFNGDIITEKSVSKGLSSLFGDGDVSGQTEFDVISNTQTLKVISAGRLVFEFKNISAGTGKVGIGTVDSGSITVSRPEVREITPVAFRDDFMRSVTDVSPWHSPTKEWRVCSIENPSRSSNAFIYHCTSEKGSTSVVGETYWDDLEVSCSFLGSSDTVSGIVFAQKDDNHYCVLRWSANRRLPGDDIKKVQDEKVASGVETDVTRQGVLQLVRVDGDKEELLAEKDGGYDPNRWYKLKVCTGGNRAFCFIDGIKIFESASDFISGGRVGLYARGKNAVEFDDFMVKNVFVPDGALLENSINETLFKGLMARSTGEFPFLFNKKLSGYRYSFAIAGDTDSSKYVFRFVPAFKDAFNYYVCEIFGNKKNISISARLIKVSEGITGNDLLEGKGCFDGKVNNFEFIFDESVLSIFRNEQPVFSGFTGYDKAKSAIAKIDGCSINDIGFNEIGYTLPVASINQVFDDETLMKAWSGYGGDWRKAEKAGSYDDIYWHRAQFYGKTELEAILTNTGRDKGDVEIKGDNFEIALSLSKPISATEKGNGYTLKYLCCVSKKTQELKLLKNADELKAVVINNEIRANRLKFCKSGCVLIGYIDDKAVLVCEDKTPVEGEKLAWAVKGITIPPENVRVYNSNLRSYSFNSAPVDWLVGSGIWEVTNRWECDPRWSFWSGMPAELAGKRIKALGSYFSDRSSWKLENLKYQLENVVNKEDKHVVLWHKDAFRGDFMAEFYVGQMMDRSRGNYSKYVRDFNITVCSDGKDLLSGYSCILGGWQNTRSAILRDGEVMVEKPGNVLNKGYVHRRWIRVRVARKGNSIRFTADYEDKGAKHVELVDLYYVDEKPLKGKRVALWSYDCGILIGRFRISAEKIEKVSDPFHYNIFTSKSIYSQEDALSEKTAE